MNVCTFYKYTTCICVVQLYVYLYTINAILIVVDCELLEVLIELIEAVIDVCTHVLQ